jgi:hypothetical protein
MFLCFETASAGYFPLFYPIFDCTFSQSNYRLLYRAEKMRPTHFALALCIASASAAQVDPSYDHQTDTYDASFAPVTVTGGVEMAPFYSPGLFVLSPHLARPAQNQFKHRCLQS